MFYHQVTQRDARRESAATAFLRPVAKRPNLTVITHAEDTRILVEDGRATGVEYTAEGAATHLARAQNEIIVSAGAVNSPRLLLLSGIGPADELRASGVEVVHDLPGVGKNLRDQLEVYITRKAAKPITYSGEDRWHRALLHALEYGLYRTGPATATITEAGAFVSSSPEVRTPEIQLHFLPAYVVWKDGARSAARIPGHGVTLLACNVRPTSSGSVTITGPDPCERSVVDPNYLADDRDMEIAIEGFKVTRRVFDAPAFQELLEAEQLPGPAVQTDEEIRAFIRKWGKTDYHPVGSCKMGVDDLSVVDPELKVHGLQGLRVVDSSSMPTIISGNTQAPPW